MSALTAAAVAYRSVTAWGWYWLFVLVLILGPELYWVFVKSQNTISDNIWAIERLDWNHPFEFATWTPVHWIIAVVIWGLFAWLSLHIPFGKGS